MRRIGRGGAVIGLAFSLVLAGCGATSSGPNLKIGDCFDVPTTADITTIPTKACTEPHGGEVFHEFDAQGGGAYPTDEAWGQLIYPICDPVLGIVAPLASSGSSAERAMPALPIPSV